MCPLFCTERATGGGLMGWRQADVASNGGRPRGHGRSGLELCHERAYVGASRSFVSFGRILMMRTIAVAALVLVASELEAQAPSSGPRAGSWAAEASVSSSVTGAG